MKKVFISFFLALCLVFSWCNSSRGEETVNAKEILKPGTFFISLPIVNYLIEDVDSGPGMNLFVFGPLQSPLGASMFGPAFGFFLSKYIYLDLAINIIHANSSSSDDSSSYKETMYSVGGYLGADLPVPESDRVFLNVESGFGYSGMSFNSGGDSNYNSPVFSCGAGIGYFITRNLALNPKFSFSHVFEHHTESDYTVGLNLNIFFPGEK